MDQGMTWARWFSLRLQEDALLAFDVGRLHTIGAADSQIVGIPYTLHGSPIARHRVVTRGGCGNRHHFAFSQPKLTFRCCHMYDPICIQ